MKQKDQINKDIINQLYLIVGSLFCFLITYLLKQTTLTIYDTKDKQSLVYLPGLFGLILLIRSSYQLIKLLIKKYKN